MMQFVSVPHKAAESKKGSNPAFVICQNYEIIVHHYSLLDSILSFLMLNFNTLPITTVSPEVIAHVIKYK